MCQVSEVGGERHSYYRPDLDLADMFGKVVFLGKGDLLWIASFGNLVVWAIASTVVLVDVGTGSSM